MMKFATSLCAVVALLVFTGPAMGQNAPAGGSMAVDTSDDNLPLDSFFRWDEAPELIQQVPCVYPEAEKKANIGGTYWVRLLVNKQGLVRKAEIGRRTGGTDALEKAALDAAKGYVFKPPKVDGKPVACWMAVHIVFKPTRNGKE